jgi:hypothetical protein
MNNKRKMKKKKRIFCSRTEDSCYGNIKKIPIFASAELIFTGGIKYYVRPPH